MILSTYRSQASQKLGHPCSAGHQCEITGEEGNGRAGVVTAACLVEAWREQ